MTVPTTGAAVWTLVGVTLRRLLRGRMLWIGALAAAAPVLYAAIAKSQGARVPLDDLFQASRLLLVLLPALFVGASVGEELEDRASTYLWSRPIARWAVLAGKLCALAPIVAALIAGGWIVASAIATGAPSAVSCLALAAGAVAASLVAAGVATLVPRHGTAMMIGYMLLDAFIGAMPFSLREISLTHQTDALAQGALGAPLIALALIGAVWSAIGWLRIRRLEL